MLTANAVNHFFFSIIRMKKRITSRLRKLVTEGGGERMTPVDDIHCSSRRRKKRINTRQLSLVGMTEKKNFGTLL